MLKSWPSCWMTMPGRSCVALTLLIFLCGRRAADGSLGTILVSEIPAGLLLTRIQNDSRRAGPNFEPSANLQYKGPHSSWSIVAPFGLFGSLFRAFGHNFFDLIGVAWKAFAKELEARLSDEDVVLDAHAEIFLGDVDAGLDGDHLAGLEGLAGLARIVNVETDIVAQAMNVILAERFAVQILAMRVDVFVGDSVNTFVALLAHVHAGFDSGHGGILRAQNDFVNFTLARSELAIGGNRSRDVRGVSGVLCANVNHDDVAVHNFAREFVVMQHCGIGTCADDGRIAFRFRAAHGVDFHHFRSDLIFEETRVHHFDGGEMGVERKVDGFAQERNFTGGLYSAQRADAGANIFQLALRGNHLQPVGDSFLVGITAIFFFVRENGEEAGIELGEFFDRRAHFREGLHGGETGARFDARIGGGHADAVPLFLSWILRPQEKNFARPVPGFGAARFRGRKEDQARGFLVVAGEGIKIVFLGKDVGLRGFFAASETPKYDGSVNLGGKFCAAVSVGAVWLAFAALLGAGQGSGGRGKQK